MNKVHTCFKMPKYYLTKKPVHIPFNDIVPTFEPSERTTGSLLSKFNFFSYQPDNQPNIEPYDKSNSYCSLEDGVFVVIKKESSNTGDIVIPGYANILGNPNIKLTDLNISLLLNTEYLDEYITEVSYEYFIRNLQQQKIFDCSCSCTGITSMCVMHATLGLSFLRDKRDRSGIDSLTYQELVNYAMFGIVERQTKGKINIDTNSLKKLSKQELINLVEQRLN